MRNSNQHKISSKEFDSLLNQSFLNLDFNNLQNEKMMQTIASNYLVNDAIPFSQKLKNSIIKNLTVIVITSLLIITGFVMFKYNSKLSTKAIIPTKKAESVTKKNPENFIPKIQVSIAQTKHNEQKRKYDSVILKQSAVIEVVTFNATISNNQSIFNLSESAQNKKQSTINQPQALKLVTDPSYVFPTLTQKEIKETQKQKKRMINALATLQKSKYVTVPTGTFNYNTKQVSVASFNMQYAEVSNVEYRTFLFDLLINNRKEEFLIAKPNQAEWNKVNEGVTYTSYKDNYFSHPAYDFYPVVNITKQGADLFCNWLTTEANNYLNLKNKPLLNDLRIPTITEWVYAAKGGRDAQYPWGFDSIQNTKHCFLANFDTQLSREELNMNCPYIKYHNATTVVGLMLDGSSTTAPVYSFNPNDYGLYCMSGNVSEMVYMQDENFKPTNKIVTKGGSWNTDYKSCKLNAIADFKNNTVGNPTVGFRPVFTFKK